jgi:hypothetical protein
MSGVAVQERDRPARHTPLRRGGLRGVRRWTTRALVGLLALVVVLYLACVAAVPFVSGATSASVNVNAPVAAVWKYGSNSRNASQWSVYFHHITPLSGPGIAPDGHVGAVRICYRNPNEKGVRWTERTMAVDMFKHRQIHTYDIHGLRLGFFSDRAEFTVDQYYAPVDASHSRLTFTTHVRRPSGLLGWLEYPVYKVAFPLTHADEDTNWAFRMNLANIAAAVAAQVHHTTYHEPHPWQRHVWYE